MDELKRIVDAIPGEESTCVATLVVLSEMFMRMYPTRNPAGFAHMIAAGARLFAVGLQKVADLLDKIFPQKTKTEDGK